MYTIFIYQLCLSKPGGGGGRRKEAREGKKKTTDESKLPKTRRWPSPPSASTRGAG
jgi:hypothetical protein